MAISPAPLRVPLFHHLGPEKPWSVTVWGVDCAALGPVVGSLTVTGSFSRLNFRAN